MTERNSMMPFVASAVLAIYLVLPGAVHAADFYSGKTITFIASDDAGGGYDTYTRLLARYIQKYIPGDPVIVVQNEPGAGGLRAAQVTYNVAEKDGTKIGNFRASNILDSVLAYAGGKSIRINMNGSAT